MCILAQFCVYIKSGYRLDGCTLEEGEGDDNEEEDEVKGGGKGFLRNI